MKRLLFAAAFSLVMSARATELTKSEVTCAVCGTKSEQVVVMSSNTMEPPDLDFRLGELMRSTMRHWVQECPACGYCASDLSTAGKAAKTVSQSPEYRKQLRDPGYPALADRFLCQMALLDAANNTTAAEQSLMCAIWTCDDAGNDDAAQALRKQAVKRIGGHPTVMTEPDVETGARELLLADLSRRSGQFDLALQYAKRGAEQKPGEILAKLLRAEQQLATNKDAARHNVGEFAGQNAN